MKIFWPKILKLPSPTGSARLRTAAAGRAPSAPLLLRRDGKPWQPGKADHRLPFMAAVAKAGLGPEVTSYSLRHSNITRHLLRGTPIRVVAALHDTSVPMIERTYSAFIAGHGDELARAALLDLAPPVSGWSQDSSRFAPVVSATASCARPYAPFAASPHTNAASVSQ